jgi:1,4-dihydroxy-2-naphthoate octaprenyltransferase
VVRIGLKASRYWYAAIVLSAFASVVFLVGVAGLPYLIMISFAALPLAFKAIKVLWKEYQSHEGLVPAQAITIQTVIATGLLVSLGLVLGRFLGK